MRAGSPLPNRRPAPVFSPAAQARAGTEDETALHGAIGKHDLQGVAAAIANGTDLNLANSHGLTPLHLAIAGKDNNIIELLLAQKDLDPNRPDRTGTTPLMSAIATAQPHVAQALIRRGNIQLNLKDDEGQTALHLAAEHNIPDVVESLLAKDDTQINDKRHAGGSALQIAACNEHAEIVKILISNRSIAIDTTNSRGYTALHTAVSAGHPDIIEVLLKAGADIDKKAEKGNLPLHIAAGKGRLSSVKPLLESGKIRDINAVNEKGYRALHFAVHEGHADVVKTLLALDNIDANAEMENGQTLIHCSLRDGHTDTLKIVLHSEKIDLHRKTKLGENMLHMAAANGNLDACNLLIDSKKFDLNDTTTLGHTAISLAAKNGHVDIVRLLLAQPGADLNTCLPNHMSALHVAALFNQTDVVDLFLKQEVVNIEQRDDYGFTALQSAADNRAEMAVQTLINAGADVNAKCHRGISVLQLAAMRGHAAVVRALIQSEHLHINDVSATGRSALHHAARGNHPEAIKALLESDRINTGIFDQDRDSALVVAIAGNHFEALEALLGSDRVDVNLATPIMGMAALPLAVRNNRLECVQRMLRSSRIDPNVQGANNWSALHLSARLGKLEITKALIASPRTDVNLRTKDGYAALHLAASQGDAPIAQALIDAGADIDIVANDGLTPLLLAAKFGQTATVRLFLDHPAVSIDAAVSLAAVEPSSLDLQTRRFLLARCADHVPKNGVPNRSLTARANFELGKLLKNDEQMAAAGPCAKDAPFRLSLALEQAWQAHQKFTIQAQTYAGELLNAAPDRDTFNLGGIGVTRDEIVNMANAQGNYALDGTLLAMEHFQIPPNVHLQGFLLRGRDLLEKVQQITAPLPVVTMERLETALMRQIDDIDPSSPVLSPFQVALTALERSNPNVLQHARFENRLLIAGLIRSQPARSRPAFEAAWTAQMTRYGLRHTLLQTEQVNEGGLVTTAPEILRLLHTYIESREDVVLRDNLRAALLQQLRFIVEEDGVCATGVVQRLLDTLSGQDDPEFMAADPSGATILNEIMRSAPEILETFSLDPEDLALNLRKPSDASPAGPSTSVAHDRQAMESGAQQALIGVAQDVLRETAIDDLVRRRGWRREAVDAQLPEAMARMKAAFGS